MNHPEAAPTGKAPQMTRPGISGISPLFIVADVAAALSFYRDRLDFEVSFQEPAQDPFFAPAPMGGSSGWTLRSDQALAPARARADWRTLSRR